MNTRLCIDELNEKDVINKKVFLRVDFNVPMTGTIIEDNTKIVKSLPTISYLLNKKCKIVIYSHLGRPNTAASTADPSALSLKPIANHLSELLHRKVTFMDDCIGDKLRDEINSCDYGTIIMTENLRFHAEEEENESSFSAMLAQPFADDGIYVNDAYGSSHRSHASTEGVTHYFKSNIKVSGMLMKQELNFIYSVIHNPCRPLAAIVGGCKISSKLPMLYNLIKIVDKLIITGGMAATFLKAKDIDVGASKVENNCINDAANIIQYAKENNTCLLTAVDVVVQYQVSKSGIGSDAEQPDVVDIVDIPSNASIVDMGPKTMSLYFGELSKCKTVVWNGPLGLVEIPKYSIATNKMIDFLASLTASGECITIAGGGDTTKCINANGNLTFTHVSTGGGALIEYLEGVEQPSILALNGKKKSSIGM